MSATRLALLAAVAAVVLWSAKAVAIGTAGGLDRSPFEGPLFFAGLAAFIVAAVSVGLALTRGRPLVVRVLAGAVAAPTLGLAVAGAVAWVVELTAAPSAERHWVWAEINLWIIAAGVLAAAVAVRRREPA